MHAVSLIINLILLGVNLYIAIKQRSLLHWFIVGILVIAIITIIMLNGNNLLDTGNWRQ